MSASAVTATVGLKLNTVETIGTNVPAATAANAKVTHNQYSIGDLTLDASSTPNATQCTYDEYAMVEGAATIDLTALSGINAGSASMNGLKPRAVLFSNPSTNANAITVAEGASNGYELLGDGFTFTLQPGASLMVYLAGTGGAVGGSAKTIDISGTGTQVLRVAAVFGT